MLSDNIIEKTGDEAQHKLAICNFLGHQQERKARNKSLTHPSL
jgi:hypothetical protein